MSNSDYLEKKKLIVNEFIEELSKHLEISQEVLISRGLSAGAFRVDQNVKVDFPDGSKMKFKYAFFLVNNSKQKVAVFTEHCGYYVFQVSSIKLISQNTTHTFYNPDEY